MTPKAQAGSAYTQDGVDIAEGDLFSHRAVQICRDSYSNSPYVKVRDMSRGHFRGPRGYQLRGLPRGCIQATAPDGVGTKMIAVSVAGDFEQAGYDLIAMTAMDITRWGGLPLGIVNVLDARTIGKDGDETNEAAFSLIKGLGTAAQEARMVVLQGETAELGVCVGSEDPDSILMANWAGMAFGVYHPRKMILGNTLSPGQIIMALRDGFRANGWSSVRKAHALRFGPEWYKHPEAQQSIREAAQPSKLYDPLLTYLNGWRSSDFDALIPLHLIVHVTGGAIRSKFAEDILFPLGLSADLPFLWDPPLIMKKVAEWRGMSDEECYESFNGGQGALVVIDPENKEYFVYHAEIFGIEARQAGEIVKDDLGPSVRIVSRFTGKGIVFHPKDV